MRDAFRDSPTTDEQKNRFLYNLLGLQGIRIFSAHPMSDNLSSASHKDFRTAVVTLFQKSVNPFRVYFDFERHRQAPTESTTDLVTVLRSLMSDCDFAGRENHHLAIHIVCGRHNTHRKGCWRFHLSTWMR
ncbi:hypothetical protein ElyMa_003535300 [Elysia marginata]|uniref:DUF4371 domain-containing protein n=1 Tax=Elysia marginata TaxID=1093978 RepID=A0AAV4EIM8_9GAST|nr:hypothetical protein ElyMa_003535300 [Elysia marginata]